MRLVPLVLQLVFLLCRAVHLLDWIFPGVGLGSDGASNMAGKTSGAAAVIQRQCPKAP